MLKIRSIQATDPRVQELLGELDYYLRDLYPPESNHIDDIDALSKSNVVFAVAEQVGEENDPKASSSSEFVGCGAVKMLHDDREDIDYGEIKRVYVSRTARGQGVAHQLMQWLEQSALQNGANCVRLETGVRQPEAIALYESRGYRRREVFAGYFDTDNSLSLFMEKAFSPR